MDEQEYMRLADAAFKRIEDLFKDVDAEDVDCERAGDVLTLTFAGNRKCIVNTQRPTRQMWCAASSRAWHFSWDAATSKWLDDKDASVELFTNIARIVKEATNIDVG
jgi:CyaY protein